MLTSFSCFVSGNQLYSSELVGQKDLSERQTPDTITKKARPITWNHNTDLHRLLPPKSFWQTMQLVQYLTENPPCFTDIS